MLVPWLRMEPFGTFQSGGETLRCKLLFANPAQTAEGVVLPITEIEMKTSDGKPAEVEYRYRVETWQGKTLTGWVSSASSTGKHWTQNVLFRGIPLARVKSFRVEARAYDWVTFPNVALKPQPRTVSALPQAAWGGGAAFRAIAAAPFTPGRTFLTTPEGHAVVFTMQDRPETDPSWTRGRKTSQSAMVQSHDTAPNDQERRLVLVEKNGTTHVTGDGFEVLNFVLDKLYPAATGKPPVYANTANGYNNWQSTGITIPKSLLPRLKEIRLEARPRAKPSAF